MLVRVLVLVWSWSIFSGTVEACERSYMGSDIVADLSASAAALCLLGGADGGGFPPPPFR